MKKLLFLLLLAIASPAYAQSPVYLLKATDEQKSELVNKTLQLVKQAAEKTDDKHNREFLIELENTITVTQILWASEEYPCAPFNRYRNEYSYAMPTLGHATSNHEIEIEDSSAKRDQRVHICRLALDGVATEDQLVSTILHEMIHRLGIPSEAHTTEIQYEIHRLSGVSNPWIVERGELDLRNNLCINSSDKFYPGIKASSDEYLNGKLNDLFFDERLGKYHFSPYFSQIEYLNKKVRSINNKKLYFKTEYNSEN